MAIEVEDEAGFVARTAAEMTPVQVVVLRAIGAKPGVSNVDLCAATGLDIATVSVTVQELVAKGLVAVGEVVQA